MTKKTFLYTEMVTAQAIINGDITKLLKSDDIEKPLVLQIAGSNSDEINEAMDIIKKYNFDEINLNVGCPSPKVSEYIMGASLMAYPNKVSEMSRIMIEKSNVPVTIKHRIGINGKGIIPDSDKPIRTSYQDLEDFVSTLKKEGINRFIIHARIAILKGLSPEKNRKVPELKYDYVYNLKKKFQDAYIEINGGIDSIEKIKYNLERTDGVMLGRIAYENPMILAFLDNIIDDEPLKTNLTRRKILEKIYSYAIELESNVEPSKPILKHLYGFFFGKKGSKKWKQIIMPPYNCEEASEIIKTGIENMPQESLDEPLNPKDF